MSADELKPKAVRVLHLMANGWELGKSAGQYGSTWIQQGGIGKGGLSETVGDIARDELLRRELIEEAGHIAATGVRGLTFYRLTEKGKEACRTL
jgi:hypothetical protein